MIYLEQINPAYRVSKSRKALSKLTITNAQYTERILNNTAITFNKTYTMW